MADYHPLITRAVDGLSNNTAEARRILYERARAALVSQLRSIDPPLSETEITRERLVLEDVVCKVEAESVRKARSEPRPAGKSGRDFNEPRFAEALRKEAPAPHKPDEPFPSDASRFDQQASSRSRLLGARGSQRRREEFKGFRRQPLRRRKFGIRPISASRSGAMAAPNVSTMRSLRICSRMPRRPRTASNSPTTLTTSSVLNRDGRRCGVRSSGRIIIGSRDHRAPIAVSPSSHLCC